jgi:hypothetical protein
MRRAKSVLYFDLMEVTKWIIEARHSKFCVEINDTYTYKFWNKFFFCITNKFEHGDGAYFRLCLEYLTCLVGILQIRFMKTHELSTYLLAMLSI